MKWHGLAGECGITLYPSEHVIRSLMAGNSVTVPDIENVLLSGRLLEEHRHATRGISYLVAGKFAAEVFSCDVRRARNGWLVVTFGLYSIAPLWRDACAETRSEKSIMTEPYSTCFFCGGEMKKITVGNFDYRLEDSCM